MIDKFKSKLIDILRKIYIIYYIIFYDFYIPCEIAWIELVILLVFLVDY